MYYGLSGKQYNLEQKPISSGGEGNIYVVYGTTDLLAKIYHDKNLSLELKDKLTFMYQHPPTKDILTQIAWPIDVLFDSGKIFCGFIMNKLDTTHELQSIYKYPPADLAGVTLYHKLIVAENICTVISEVHRAGYIFGDFNPMNIGVNINTGTVAFFDADTYHFSNKVTGVTYRSSACCPGYVAPELIKKCRQFSAANPQIKDVYAHAPLPTFSLETDNFALAIHIFKLLMNGFTPYSGVPKSVSVSQASPGINDIAVERNNYCFGPGKKPMADAMPTYDSLPPYIQTLLDRAFISGYNTPAMRPTADEWLIALQQYEQDLKQCSSNQNHYYYNRLVSCPFCEADQRYTNALAAAMKPSSSQSQKTFPQAPVITTRPIVPSSTTVPKSTNSSNITPTPSRASYSSSTTTRRAMPSKLTLMIVGILIVAGIAFFAFMSGVDRDTVEIINDNLTLFVGESAEIRIRSSAPRLTANADSCIDVEWENDKASGDRYYLTVTGTFAGTGILKIYKTENEDIFDTIEITVISPNGSSDSTPDFHAEHGSFETALPISLNTQYQDSLEDSYSENWYMFSTAEAGTAMIVFTHPLIESSDTYWIATVYGAENNPSSEDDLTILIEVASTGNDIELESSSLGLAAGKYYIKVESYSGSYSSYHSPEEYGLTLIFEASTTCEMEENNSAKDANRISLNTPFTGAIVDKSDLDWFKFDLETTGTVFITFTHDVIESEEPFWTITVYDASDYTGYEGDLSELYCFNSYGNKTAEDSPVLGLPAGTYYLQIDHYSGSYYSYQNSMDYNITVNYTESDSCELEINDTAREAGNIALNQPFVGSISDSYDVDWYTFLLDSSGLMTINFTHEVIESDNPYWTVTIYDSTDYSGYEGDLKDLVSYDVPGNKTSVDSVLLGLSAGTYYLKVTEYSGSYYSYHNDMQYNLTLNFEPTDYCEKEINDSANKANQIEQGVMYKGALSSSYDYDWFKFDMASNGGCQVRFEHDLIESDNPYWTIEVYDASNYTGYEGDLDLIDSIKIEGNAKETEITNLVLPAGTNYIKVAYYSGSYYSYYSSTPYGIVIAS